MVFALAFDPLGMVAVTVAPPPGALASSKRARKLPLPMLNVLPTWVIDVLP